MTVPTAGPRVRGYGLRLPLGAAFALVAGVGVLLGAWVPDRTGAVLGVLAAIAVGGGTGLAVAGRLAAPLRLIADRAVRLAEGDLTSRLELTRRDP